MNASSPVRKNTQDRTPEKSLDKPVGAIWIKNYKLKSAMLDYLNVRVIACPHCAHSFNDKVHESELDTVFRSHSMMVKVNLLKEKFIALQNSKKVKETNPDFFLHVYQASTGANPVYPFSSFTSRTEKMETGQTGESEAITSVSISMRLTTDSPHDVSTGVPTKVAGNTATSLS